MDMSQSSLVVLIITMGVALDAAEPAETDAGAGTAASAMTGIVLGVAVWQQVLWLKAPTVLFMFTFWV